MSLDHAQALFAATKDKETATAVILEAVEYWHDSMIGEVELLAILSEAAPYARVE